MSDDTLRAAAEAIGHDQLTDSYQAPAFTRCGCTIHEDRGSPCSFSGPLTSYRDPLSQVCEDCMAECWGAA